MPRTPTLLRLWKSKTRRGGSKTRLGEQLVAGDGIYSARVVAVAQRTASYLSDLLPLTSTSHLVSASALTGN